MPAPPDEQSRRLGQPAALSTLDDHIHRDAEGSQSVAATPDGRLGDEATVADLDDYRSRRLARPWPGWWGGHELSTWTWAERTRRGCCA